MDAVKIIRGRFLPILKSNIDTDTVTPARFLKMTGRDSGRLADALFHDWRFGADGAPIADFPMNKPEFQGAQILLAGENFGCGSSREKAPWALLAAGLRAIVSTSMADIFRSNALRNGLLPVIVESEAHQLLRSMVMQNPALEATIDVDAQTMSWGIGPGHATSFPIDPFSKKCLLEGLDELGYVLRHTGAIALFESERERAFDPVPGA
jgi:3-isopropylmalate/(R)-2-methylmalate dehydratase small subunit